LELNNKKKMQIIVVWLIVAFIIMWLLSGACGSIFVAPSEVSSVCSLNQGISGLSGIPIINLFLPLGNWVSMMFWFAPIAGMVLGYFFIRWWNNYFDSKEAISIIFLVAMLFVLFVGFFVNVMWYNSGTVANASGQPEVIQCTNGQVIQSIKNYSLHPCLTEATSAECDNTVSMINNENYTNAQRNCSNEMNLVFPIKYWPELRGSIFFTFVLGVLAVWLPLFAFEQIEKRKNKKK